MHHASDVLVLAGIGLLGIGLWWLCPALALIVLGGLLLSAGLWGASR